MAKEKNYIVTASSLNIRVGPGTDYEIVGSVPKGEEILSPNTEGWMPVVLEDDTTGWVAAKFLKEAPAGEAVVREKPAPKVSEFDFPLIQDELIDTFGTPNYSQSFRNNLIKIDLSEFADPLAHVRTFDDKPFTSIYGHNLLEAPLKMALRLVCERGLAKELKTYDGCFNIRAMKSGSSYSVHSWGLALDFNQATNPFTNPSVRSWPELVTDFSEDFVKCFLEAGFEWGGSWHSVHDAMHFQLAWTRDWTDSSEPLRPQITEKEAAPPEGITPSIQGFDSSTREGTIQGIAAECKRQGISSPAQIAYVLATTEWETANKFQPVREAFWKDDDWRKEHLRYYPYYGRGYVQLTWKDNYKKYEKILGIDLENEPDKAMDPNIARFILVHGFKTGAFTGKKITNYINEEEEPDFYNARKCINGLDQAEKIADLAENYLDKIKEGIIKV